LDFDGIAKVFKGLHQALGLRDLGTAVEMVCTEILVDGSVLEHVADGGENGGDSRCPAVAKRLMSVPISEIMPCALSLLVLQLALPSALSEASLLRRHCGRRSGHGLI
jgi:hypothetical protein